MKEDMFHATLSLRPSDALGGYFASTTTTFTATGVARGDVRPIASQPIPRSGSHEPTTTLAGSTPPALHAITTRDVEEGEREVREGGWIRLEDLRRELRELDDESEH